MMHARVVLFLSKKVNLLIPTFAHGLQYLQCSHLNIYIGRYCSDIISVQRHMNELILHCGIVPSHVKFVQLYEDYLVFK